jgi:hypothetical protein
MEVDSMNSKQVEAIVKAVLKADKPTKAKKVKATPRAQLVAFMKDKGYGVKSEKSSTYTNKAGEVKQGKELTFNNGKTYMVGESRFWGI